MLEALTINRVLWDDGQLANLCVGLLAMQCGIQRTIMNSLLGADCCPSSAEMRVPSVLPNVSRHVNHKHAAASKDIATTIACFVEWD